MGGGFIMVVVGSERGGVDEWALMGFVRLRDLFVGTLKPGR